MFSSVDSYFNSIDGLYQYNLTAIADNITVANFGWNQSVMYPQFLSLFYLFIYLFYIYIYIFLITIRYTALDKLNNNTYPEYYDLGNYTDANVCAHHYSCLSPCINISFPFLFIFIFFYVICYVLFIAQQLFTSQEPNCIRKHQSHHQLARSESDYLQQDCHGMYPSLRSPLPLHSFYSTSLLVIYFHLSN